MVLAAAAWAAPVAVSAQSRGARDEVEAQHNQGNRLRQQGRNVEARDLFRALYERTHEPRAIIRQGLAEMALEDWLAADEHLRAGLAVTGDAFVQENRARIEEQLRVVSSRVGTLVIECLPEGATVTINGDPRGRCPLSAPLRLRVGPALVRVEHPGMNPVEEQSSVVAGDDPTTLRIRLQPLVTGDPVAEQEAAAVNRRRARMFEIGRANV